MISIPAATNGHGRHHAKPCSIEEKLSRILLVRAQISGQAFETPERLEGAIRGLERHGMVKVTT